MGSIRNRLAGGLTLSLILLLLLQWWVLGTSVRQLTEHYLLTRLQHDAEALLAALDVKADPFALDTGRIDNIYDNPLSGHYYKITVDGTVFRSRSLWDVDLSQPPISTGENVVAHSEGPSSQQLLLYHTVYQKNKRVVHISVAEDQTQLLREITIFQNTHAGISLAVLALLIILQSFIVSGGLSPLKKARQEITALEQGVINELDENVPSELLPLIVELNHQLTAFKRRLDRSRNAAGNLAHALKTPLALLTQLTEQDLFDTHPELRQKILQHTSVIQQNIDRELRRARLAGGQIGGNRMPLYVPVSELLDILNKMYKDKAIACDPDIATDIVVTMDRQDLMELLGNVLDNAFKWARQQVRLSATKTDADGVLVQVQDDGPGCSDQDLKSLTQRGRRADENIAGHGLGLSIVADIVADYGGQLRFENSTELGGLKVTISLKV